MHSTIKHSPKPKPESALGRALQMLLEKPKRQKISVKAKRSRHAKARKLGR
jgi:hypothetical protein